MTTEEESTFTETRFPRRLARKVLGILLPAILFPGAIVGIDAYYFSRFTTSYRILGVLITSLVLGLIFALVLKRFLDRRILNPIKKMIKTTQRFTLGDLKERTHLTQEDEVGELALLIDSVGKTLDERFHILELRLNAREIQLRTTNEIAQLATHTRNLESFLQKTTDLIAERFNHHNVAIYLVDQAFIQALPNKISVFHPQGKGQEEDTIPIQDATTQADLVLRGKHTDIFSQPETERLIPALSESQEIKSTATIPISSNDSVIGILHIKNRKKDAIRNDEIEIFQSIANQIAENLRNLIDPKTSTVPFMGDPFLYHASHAIITANTEAQVYEAITKTLKKLSHPIAFFVKDQDYFKPQLFTDQIGQENTQSIITENTIPEFSTTSLIHETFPIKISRPDEINQMPEPLKSVIQKLPFDPLELYPIFSHKILKGFLLWGVSEGLIYSSEELDTIRRLAEITATSLEKIDAIEEISSQLIELQTLNTVSQSISSVTNLEKLYEVIHQQIIHVMGAINFFIALYDEATNSIEIPYMDDGNEILSVPPFPLGQGLTSIIIRTRQPLMIVEDTVNRSRALGAIVTGDNPARSWLGVPMILRDELIGAIVVQDLENEYRFDENDMRLLTTLSAQVAIAVWNTRLIEIAYKRSLRDHQLYEITNKIRDQIDIEGVISTTAQELGKALNARKATIRIYSEIIPQTTNGNGTAGARNI